MPLNGKFIAKYGMSFKDMDIDARWQALMSELFDLREDIEPVKDVCNTVDRHKLYFKALWVVLALIVVPLVLKLWIG